MSFKDTVQKATHRFLHKYKYIITTVFFVSVIGYFDDNSIYNLMLYNEEIQHLKAEVQYFEEKYERDTRTVKNLDKDPRYIEDVAREEYFMKRPNEDVYVFRTK